METLRGNRLLLMASIFFALNVLAPQVFAEEVTDVHELKRVIETQQEQLDTLQKQIAEQGKLIQQLLAKEPASATKTAAKETVAVSAAPQEKVVTSGEERVKLSISGHHMCGKGEYKIKEKTCISPFFKGFVWDKPNGN